LHLRNVPRLPRWGGKNRGQGGGAVRECPTRPFFKVYGGRRVEYECRLIPLTFGDVTSPGRVRDTSRLEGVKKLAREDPPPLGLEKRAIRGDMNRDLKRVEYFS
jgi:hypothetical protein